MPPGNGLARTFITKSKRIKAQLALYCHVERPDYFGPHWGFKLTFTPVLRNPIVLRERMRPAVFTATEPKARRATIPAPTSTT